MVPKSLITAASFTPNSLQFPDAWIGHLPFAAWVIQEISPKIFVELGTHSGNSYFSFCQSVVESGISTKCYAVDTWQGDEHASYYDEDIFAKVNAHHREHYAGFSRLLRMTFNDAESYFADESIELLHIDGLHTYEATRHDFDTWLPKLAPGAVVLFHDTNVREYNFGVWKLWEELQSRYPNNLEFVHSHGLGVLQLNNAPDNKKLEWLQPSSPEKQRLINYFAALGSRQSERYELNELKQVVAERDSQIISLGASVAERDGQIAGLNQAVQTLTETVAEKEQQTTALTGQLCEITISKAWRMAMMMRSIRVWLAPPTSWRARLLRRMLSLVLFPLKIRQNWRIARDLALISASNLYDELWYLANNPDVAQAGVDPARHYLRHGGFEGRSPGPNFSSAWYLDAYEDVKKAGINPLIHYLKQGREEGRHPNLENNDIALIRSSGLFDEAWYLANNPDVAQAGVDPARHYLCHGGFEGFDPGTDFSSAWYLDTYCDVRISGENPLVHFLRYGRAEGRDPKPQKLTTAVRASLQNILKRLDISCTANEIISALGEYGNYIKTRQIMANIVEVETFLSAAKNKKVYSLIHAAQLPEASPNTRKKNILFITSEFPDPYHGGGNRVLNFIESLSKHNNVYLCAAFCQSEHEIHLPPVEKYCRSILKIPYENYGGNQEEIREWLNGLPMDIVHYEWLFSLKNYAPDFGKHQIFTYMEAVCLRLLMDMGRLIPLSKEWLDKFEQLSNALQFELVLAAPLHTRIAVTSKDGEFFKKLFPFQEYAVLNHGLNFENFTLPDVEPEPQTLVFVGNYKHYPNADAMHFFFGKIWEDIRNEMPETRIYVVGTTPPSELLQMADGKNIIVTGAVPDVRPYIQKASVCIAPLVTGAGLRGKVIEYAALRRAFVATSIATTDLNFKDGIDYFCADQPAEFSQRIISLLKNPELARQMADSAYHTARENYGTERLTGYLLSLYQYLENQSNAR